MLESLYLNLGQHDALSDGEKALLAGAMTFERHFATGQDIVASGSRPTYSTLILDGLAARYKVLENGGRQFTSREDFSALRWRPATPCRPGVQGA